MSIVKILEIIKNWRNLELVIPLPDSNSLLPTFGLISCEYKWKKLCTCHIWICIINSYYLRWKATWSKPDHPNYILKLHSSIFLLYDISVFFIFRKSKLGMFSYNIYSLQINDSESKSQDLHFENWYLRHH